MARFLGLLSILLSAHALAAGGWLSENGGADMAMAGAGRTALALDAASQVANPAALALLARSSVTIAMLPLALETRFEGSAVSPGNARDRSGTQLAGALYGAHEDGRLAYGLAAYSYLGLGFDLGDEWVGRRSMERASLVTFNIAPGLAYRIDDTLTVGGSIAAQWAGYEMALTTASDAALLGPPAGVPDGRLSIDGDSWAPGGQLGALWEPRERLQLGLAWTAPIRHTADVRLHEHALHPTLAALLPAEHELRLDFTIPQQFAFGLAYGSPHDRLLSAGLTWQDWSALGNSRFRLPGADSDVFARGLDDTWGLNLGLRQRLDPRWTVTAGIGYEGDPAPGEGVPVFFPVTEQWRFAAGVEHALTDETRLRLMLSVIAQGTAKVVQTAHPLPLPGIGPLDGSYEPSALVMLGIAVDFASAGRASPR